MNLSQSFRDKPFQIADPEARIRNEDDLLTYATYKAGDTLPPGAHVGDFKIISKETRLLVTETKILLTGSQSRTVYARTTSIDGATAFGWTSTRNFYGQFINETIGGLALLQAIAGSG